MPTPTHYVLGLAKKDLKEDLINTLAKKKISGKNCHKEFTNLICEIGNNELIIIYNMNPPDNVEKMNSKTLISFLKSKIEEKDALTISVDCYTLGYNTHDLTTLLYIPSINKLYIKEYDDTVSEAGNPKDLDISFKYPKQKTRLLQIDQNSPGILKQFFDRILDELNKKNTKLTYDGIFGFANEKGLHIRFPLFFELNLKGNSFDDVDSIFFDNFPHIKKKTINLIKKEGLLMDERITFIGETNRWIIYQGVITKVFYKIKKGAYTKALSYKSSVLFLSDLEEPTLLTKEDLEDPEVAQIILKHTLLQ